MAEQKKRNASKMGSASPTSADNEKDGEDRKETKEALIFKMCVTGDWNGALKECSVGAGKHVHREAHRGSDGRTALHYAAELGAPVSVIEALLEFHDEEEQTNPHHRTPSMASVVDLFGMTALHDAANNLSPPSSTKALLKAHSPAALVQSKDGRTPLHAVERWSSVDIDDQADARIPLMVQTAEIILTAVPEAAFAVDSLGRTPLHAASRIYIPLAVLHTLLSHGSQATDIRDNLGFTPLHWAARHDDEEAGDRVRSLITVSPSTTLSKDNDEKTPLHNAIFWSPDVTQAITEADPHSVAVLDQNGCSPLALLCNIFDHQLLDRHLFFFDGTASAFEDFSFADKMISVDLEGYLERVNLQQFWSHARHMIRALVSLSEEGASDEHRITAISDFVPHQVLKVGHDPILCPNTILRLGIGLYAHKLDQMKHGPDDNLPLHTAAQRASELPRGTVSFVTMLSKSAANICNRQGHLPLSLLLQNVSNSSQHYQKEAWNDSIKYVLRANPAALAYENIPACIVPMILSKVAQEKKLSFLFGLIRGVPTLLLSSLSQ